MPKRLILLAGLHRTATTSIQKTCVANFDALSRADILYLPESTADFRFERRTGNHSRLIRGMFTNRANLSPSRRLELSRKIRQIISESGKDTVMIIAEAASTLEVPELSSAREFFRHLFGEIQVLICVRKPVEWLDSMVAQQVAGRHRATKLSIEKSIEGFRTQGNLIRRRVENLRSVFNDVKIYPFSDLSRLQTSPADLFMKHAGVTLDAALTSTQENARASDLSVRLISALLSSPAAWGELELSPIELGAAISALRGDPRSEILFTGDRGATPYSFGSHGKRVAQGQSGGRIPRERSQLR